MAWTDEETAIIEKYYPNTGMKELQKLLPNKTKGAIKGKARYLGIKKEEGYEIQYDSIWSESELKILIEKYAITPIDELIKLLPNKTKEQIRQRASYEELKKDEETLKETFFVWEDEELLILNTYYEVSTMDELEEKIPNKTPRQILSKANLLGLKKDKEFISDYRVEKMMKGRNNIWSNEEIAILHRYYEDEGIEKCKELLEKRSLSQIKTKASHLGLKSKMIEEEWERVKMYQNHENLKQFEFIYKKRKGWLLSGNI